MSKLHFPTQISTEKYTWLNQKFFFSDGADRVCKLNKAIHGLKQAPRSFHLKLKEVLNEQRLIQSRTHPCIFYRNGSDRIVLCIYVDGALVAGNSSNTSEISRINILNKPSSFLLGIEVEAHKNNDIFMHQERYVK